MLKWENIQTKTELEYIIGVLKEKISCLEIKRIFSFYPEIPAKIDNEIVYKALIDPLYILFNDDYCLIINFIYYSKIYIEYRKLTDEERNQFINTIYNEEIDYFNNYSEVDGWDFDENRHRIEGSLRVRKIVKLSGKYDAIDDIQVNGFNSEYSKWIYDGRWNDIITIPAGGDYFNSIKIILKNGITISMNQLPLEIGGEYNLIIEDKNNQLNYQITNVD